MFAFSFDEWLKLNMQTKTVYSKASENIPLMHKSLQGLVIFVLKFYMLHTLDTH